MMPAHFIFLLETNLHFKALQHHFFYKKRRYSKKSITFVTENCNKELANKYINNEKEPIMDAGCHPDLRPGNNLVYLY